MLQYGIRAIGYNIGAIWAKSQHVYEEIVVVLLGYLDTWELVKFNLV